VGTVIGFHHGPAFERKQPCSESTALVIIGAASIGRGEHRRPAASADGGVRVAVRGVVER
jgi:hypothetical protein